MDKDTKMSLIKDLLAGRLTKKQRRSYADLESVDRELKIQWNESENKAIDFKIKEQIWERVKARCVDRKRNSSNRTKMVFCRSFTRSFTNNRRILDEFSQR